MVRDWLPDFLHRLSISFPPHDWPDGGTEDWGVFVEDWISALARNQVTEADADAARQSLLETPPRFRSEYIPAIVSAVKASRGPTTGGGGVSDRDSAMLASKACVYCEGMGLAVVWASKPDPDKRIAETASAYCICQAGRWIEANHREKSPDVHKRIPDLTNVLNGRSFWRLNPPWMSPVDTAAAVRMVPVPAQPDARAAAASRDCPECKGSGWASRRAAWHSLPRPFVVDLFCRCPLGRWRKAHDPDPRRNHDDLQARPQLWDSRLTHPTWRDRPTEPDVDIDADCAGKWRYLGVDEPAPQPIAATRDIVAPAGRKFDPALGPLPPFVEAPAPAQPPAADVAGRR